MAASHGRLAATAFAAASRHSATAGRRHVVVSNVVTRGAALRSGAPCQRHYGSASEASSEAALGGNPFVGFGGSAPSSGADASTAARQQSPDAAMLLGRPRGQISSSAFVQQANSIFGRVRGGLATAGQLVEALQQLAAIARDAASPEDVDALAARPLSKQLLRDLAAKLPRDSAEQVDWDPSWTPEVISALRQLRFREVDPQLGVRLGHALVQSASSSELEVLLHATIDLCLAFSGSGPRSLPSTSGGTVAFDNYGIWLLGERLVELCQSRQPGELPLVRLVSLLHLFAHPALKGRTHAPVSPVVLKHIRHGLPGCTLSEIAKILQAYHGEPAAADVLSEAIAVLAATAPAQETSDAARGEMPHLAHAALPELTAVANALPSLNRGDVVDQSAAMSVAGAVLRRLAAIVEEDAASDLELAVECAAGAVGTLGSAADASQVASLAESLGQRGIKALDAASPDALARLLCLGLRESASSSSSSSAAWRADVAAALATRLGELLQMPAGAQRLSEFAVLLADVHSGVELGGEAGQGLFDAVQQIVGARRTTFPVEDLALVARACATAGILDSAFLEALDVAALLAKTSRMSVLADLAWASAVLEASEGAAFIGDATWPLLLMQLSRGSTDWSAASAEDKARLYEALVARAQLQRGSWPVGSVAADIAEAHGDKAVWRDAWSEQRAARASSVHGDDFAALLTEMSVVFERDVEGTDQLYTMPFLLTEQKVIIDLMASPARHQVSGEVRGEIVLRHHIWREQGHSILAIRDGVWAQLIEDEGSRRPWLEERLTTLRRISLVQQANLDAEVADQLRGIPLGDDVDGGLKLDGLKALAERPAEVQDRAVKKFVHSMREVNVTNPTGWLIGILKKEDQVEVEVQQRKAEEAKIRKPAGRRKDSASSAASASASEVKPQAGWKHPDARSLDSIKIGQLARGKVTQVLHGRVWVDAGFTKDVTFLAGSQKYDVGMTLTGLQVVSVNKERERVEVKPTASTRAARQVALKKPTAAGDKADKSETKNTSETKPKTEGSQASGASSAKKNKNAAVRKPVSGWGREGKPLAELRVGEAVSGTVTNVYIKRIWVNIGAVKDATIEFATKEDARKHKVGDVLQSLTVAGVDLEKGLVQANITTESE